MRATVVVLLLALALTGCSIDIVPSGGGPASAAPTAEDVPDEASTVPVDNPIDATPGPDDQETRTGDERTAVSITKEFWSRWFDDQGLRYIPPQVAGGYEGTRGPSCAGEPSVPGNAYYCPSSASQLSTRVSTRYASRRATASEHAGRPARCDCEAGWRRRR